MLVHTDLSDVICRQVCYRCRCFFFLMIRRPPRSTLDRSSAASDVYKRQTSNRSSTAVAPPATRKRRANRPANWSLTTTRRHTVSYTHLRAHETVLDIVCRLLLEKHKHIILYPSRTHRIICNNREEIVIRQNIKVE